MSGSDICKALQNEIGEMFVCAEHGDYQRIHTPYLYPDGDNITLFCKFEGDAITVTDLAETTGWLRMQSVSPRRSPKQKQFIDDACVTHGVEFNRGMLQARCRSAGELAATVTRVAQAALRVSDLWFTFRTRTGKSGDESITNEVADYLTRRELQFERSPEFTGFSEKQWKVDFHVHVRDHSSLVVVLSTASRSATRKITDHVVAAWYDLRGFAEGPAALRFVSLFDDTADVWTERDFQQVEPLSAVALWSRRDDFAETLTAAA